MAEETVTVGDTEVQITETDDGFEVTEAEPDPGSIEKLKEDTGIESGDRIGVGKIDRIVVENGHQLRLYVNNSSWDVFKRETLDSIKDSPWSIVKIEFDAGYIKLEDTDY